MVALHSLPAAAPPVTLSFRPAVAGVVLAVFAACDGGPVVEADPCERGDVIVVGRCFLGLTVESDSADAVARLGPPARYFVTNDLGLRFVEYDDHPEVGGGRVFFTRFGLYQVSATGPFGVRTAERVGRGASSAEVRGVYGEPDRAIVGPTGPSFEAYDFPADSVEFVFTYDVTGETPVVNSISMRSQRRVLVFDRRPGTPGGAVR